MYNLHELDNENKIKSVEVIVNNKKEKTYKCEYKEESLYNDSDEMEDEHKYYEVNIQKKE